MLVVISFFQDNAWLAIKNIEHAIWLDESVPYPCLLVYDKQTSREVIDGVKRVASQYFSGVTEYNCGLPPTRKWPQASNFVFHQSVWHMISLAGKRKLPRDHWLWWEVDSVPMKKGWLKQINEAYLNDQKPFLGHWNADTRVWNGVSVYPYAPDVNRYLHESMFADANPWDWVASQRDNVERYLSKRNDLFQHNWADPATNAPFTFRRIQEVEALIRPTVVLFHRCKDGSLIDVLQGKAGPQPEDRITIVDAPPEPMPEPEEQEYEAEVSEDVNPKATVTCCDIRVIQEEKLATATPPPPKKQHAAKNFVVALPFCAKDANLAILNLELCLKLDGSCGYDAILSYDHETPIAAVREVRRLARKYYVNVDTFVYSPPTKLEWPRPQNHAWSKLGAYIERHFQGSWFWFEQDAIPLKKGWLDTLVNEFTQSQKFFMGYILSGLGHMNGVAFYPCNIGHYVPRYKCLVKAFDVAIRQETIHLTHNANHLFQNVWGFNADGVHSFGTCKAPSFPDQQSVDKMVDFEKVIFHRAKDGTLQQRLLERLK